MRAKTTFLILSTTVMSVSLSGCFLKGFFNNSTSSVEPITIAKTELRYTYQDLSNNNVDLIDSTPVSGNPKILVVPVWFTNSSKFISISNKEIVKEDIRKAYLGTDEETGWKSVRGFYQEESKGKLSLDAVVTDWYSCGYSSSHYYSPDSGGWHTMDLVRDSVEWYKTTYGDSSMSSFDSDKNGYIDGVLLIYGAPDYSVYQTAKDSSNMWAYCFWLQEQPGTPYYPSPNTFFWASYDFMYGKTKKVGNYASGDTTNCNLDTHTYIHEMGHVLGLDDYYDYSNKYRPAGSFSMQDYNVGGHDPYSVMALGWAEPYVPKTSCTLSIKPFQDSHDVILLSPNFSNYSPFDEYLLLEYWTPTGLNKFDSDNRYMNGYPKGPTERGIRLWHVDGRLLRNGQFASEIVSGMSHQHAMSNTYYSPELEGYYSPLGEKYCDYNILQLIRNNTKETYRPTSFFKSSDLFIAGDQFTMSRYGSQFVHNGKLNSSNSLGWSFKVNSITSEEAIITFTRG